MNFAESMAHHAHDSSNNNMISDLISNNDNAHLHHIMGEAMKDGTGEDIPFCRSGRGGGMIMYMDGFHWSLQGNQPCLNLLLPHWTLNSREKFWVAMAGVFLLAMLVEGFSKLRHYVVRASRTRARSTHPRDAWIAMLLRWTVTVFHGVQALLGYNLMLITMTFSIELFLAVVAGLAAGYAVFYQSSLFCAPGFGGMMGEDTDSNQDEDLHVTSNPCCEFMSEESREVPATATEVTTRRRRLVQQPPQPRRDLINDSESPELTQPLVPREEVSAA